MNAYFCDKTGVRLVAPGVSKSVDPINGVDAFNEPAPAKTAATVDKPADKASAKPPSADKANER